MAEPHEDQIPREILEAEYKRSLPPRPQRPGFLGFPAIPDDLIDVATKYLPWLVLAGSITNGFAAASVFIQITSSDSAVTSPGTGFGAFISLLASVAGAAAFFWLSDRRQLGWFLLAVALGLQFLSSLIISGGTSILGGLISLAITVYVLQQLRGEYTE